LWSTIAGLMAKPPYEAGANVVGLLGLVGAVTIFAAPILGRLTDQLGARVMIVVSAVMLLIAFLLVSQAERGLWTLIVALACIDLGYRSTLLANQTRIYPLQPTAQVRLNTVFMTSVFLGGAAGSLAGAFAARWSWIGIAAAG